ncbi:MAG: hypothetical protein AAGL49_13310, partial [Pseudomonadota bacterium]
WDANTGELIASLEGHENWVLSAAFDPFGVRIVTASIDRSIGVWEAATGALLFRRTVHEDLIADACFDPSGGRIATASWDGRAAVWRLAEDDVDTLDDEARTFTAEEKETAEPIEAALEESDPDAATSDGFAPFSRDDPRRPAFLTRRLDAPRPPDDRR